MSSTKEDPSARLWYALDVEIDSAAREAVEYALMEAGALGTETNDADLPRVRVTGYFDLTPKGNRTVSCCNLFRSIRTLIVNDDNFRGAGSHSQGYSNSL